MNEIVVLIPCYNEEQTVAKVVRDFRNALPDAVIYVYDNNSGDATAQKAAAAGALVRTVHKRGKGRVIRRMLREIEARCYIIVDGDDTYPAEHAPVMVNAVLNKSIDMIVGDRLSTTYERINDRRFHYSGNRLVRFLVNTLFRTQQKDILSGYRGLSRSFAQSFPCRSHGFEVEAEMTVHALKSRAKISHIAIDYRPRPPGSFSKLRTIPDGIRILIAVFTAAKG